MLKLLTEVVRYAAASVVALVVDVGLLMLLTREAHWHYLVAGTASFLVGASVAYVLSIRFVFAAHRLNDRRLEFGSFIVIGLLGLGINALVLFVTVTRLGVALFVGKCAAATCTFFANFVLRRQLLFRVGTQSSAQR